MTQNIETAVISAYGPQENDLFEEKTKFYHDVTIEIQRAYTRNPKLETLRTGDKVL